MRRRLPFLAALLCLLMLLSLWPAAGFAEDGDIVIDEPDEDWADLISDEEIEDGLIVLPGEESWLCPEEELRPFYGEYGWLQLALDRSLLEQVGHQRGGQACACYALAYCRTLLDGEAQPYSDFNLGTNEDDAWCSWTAGSYDSLNFTDACEVYERMVKELCGGNPVVILVHGRRTQQHYVAIVGFENVVDGQPLTADNFLMLDPCAADFTPQNLGKAELDLKKTAAGVYQLLCDYSAAALPLEAHKSSYLSRCSFTPISRIVRAHRGAMLSALPCDARLDADAAPIGTLCVGESAMATALVENMRGEYWYKVSTDDGKEGYVFAGSCIAGRTSYDDLTLDDLDLPFLLTAGEPFTVRGNLRASRNVLSSLTATVTAEGETTGEPLLRAEIADELCWCSLEQSGIAQALRFDTLEQGEYRLELTAVCRQYYSADGKTLQYTDQTLRLLSLSFTVAPGDGRVWFF